MTETTTPTQPPASSATPPTGEECGVAAEVRKRGTAVGDVCGTCHRDSIDRDYGGDACPDCISMMSPLRPTPTPAGGESAEPDGEAWKLLRSYVAEHGENEVEMVREAGKMDGTLLSMPCCVCDLCLTARKLLSDPDQAAAVGEVRGEAEPSWLVRFRRFIAEAPDTHLNSDAKQLLTAYDQTVASRAVWEREATRMRKAIENRSDQAAADAAYVESVDHASRALAEERDELRAELQRERESHATTAGKAAAHYAEAERLRGIMAEYREADIGETYAAMEYRKAKGDLKAARKRRGRAWMALCAEVAPAAEGAGVRDGG